MTTIADKPALTSDPIIEAIFELRFTCKPGRPNHLLPGVIYAQLAKEFPNSVTLDVNNLPIEIREKDQNLRYAATQRFVGDRFQVNVGPRVFVVSCPRPYVGWEDFKPVILRCLDALQNTDFVDIVERFSLRYINLIPAGQNSAEQFSQINFNGDLGGFNLAANGTSIKSEILHNDHLNIVQVSANTTVRLQPTNETLSGIALDIDTIKLGPVQDFWANADTLIELSHESETDIFFKTASKEALKKYGAADD